MNHGGPLSFEILLSFKVFPKWQFGPSFQSACKPSRLDKGWGNVRPEKSPLLGEANSLLSFVVFQALTKKDPASKNLRIKCNLVKSGKRRQKEYPIRVYCNHQQCHFNYKYFFLIRLFYMNSKRYHSCVVVSNIAKAPQGNFSKFSMQGIC